VLAMMGDLRACEAANNWFLHEPKELQHKAVLSSSIRIPTKK
jgi:hypothetical protein